MINKLLVFFLLVTASATLCFADGLPFPDGLRFSGDLPVDISSEKLTFSLKGGDLVFSGSVRLSHGEWSLECERLEVKTQSEGSIERFIATGNVYLRYRDWTARCGRLLYAKTADTLTLEDSPLLMRGSNSVAGRKIVLSLSAGDVAIENASATVSVPATGVSDKIQP